MRGAFLAAGGQAEAMTAMLTSSSFSCGFSEFGEPGFGLMLHIGRRRAAFAGAGRQRSLDGQDIENTGVDLRFDGLHLFQ